MLRVTIETGRAGDLPVSVGAAVCEEDEDVGIRPPLDSSA